MSVERKLKGGAVKELITKFFYRDNNLCFQIMLDLEGKETVIYKEYVDYTEYKKAFAELQQIRTKNQALIIPNKSLKLEVEGMKVA